MTARLYSRDAPRTTADPTWHKLRRKMRSRRFGCSPAVGYLISFPARAGGLRRHPLDGRLPRSAFLADLKARSNPSFFL